jgi:adenylate cyclase
MERRLAAILATDVVGYSRLIRADEEGTLAALKTLRSDLIDPKISEHHGRVVKLMGDGMLAEFASVVDAVRAAVESQQAVAEHNAGLPEDKRIEFRIGINLGDVVIDGDDIHGDGVNIAARLEGMAEPGGICVSGMVHEQIRDRIDLPFEDLGEQKVKNIDRPVRVWQWIADAGSAASVSAKTDEPLPLPNKPSIAVLPFENMSGDVEQEYFADGIAEDIITELSRYPTLFVIARNSSFAYKGQKVKIQDIGGDLGVQYVVEGSVRKARDRVRVTVQLIEAKTGNHVWAERYDRELDDIFAVQDEVVRTIVASMTGRLEKVGSEHAKRKPPSSLDAYDYLLRGREFYVRFTPEDSSEARTMFENAIALDPAYAAAYAGLAKTHYMDWLGNWSASPNESFKQFRVLAEQSVALDESDSRTHTAMASASLHGRHYDRAQYHFERAVALNPSDTRALVLFALFEMYTGEPARAIKRIGDASRLNPFGKYGWYLGRAYYSLRQYGDAIAAFENLRDPVAPIRAWIVASYAQAGKRDHATRAAADFMAAARSEFAFAEAPFPANWIAFFAERCPYQNREDLDHLLDGLRKAGLAE